MIVDALPAAENIADQFGWAAPLSMTPAADGAMGRIWRLDTEAASYAVKELYWAHDADREEPIVATQVAFCDLARAAGVTAPANLTTPSGQYVITLPEHLGGRLVRAYEWIEGRPVTPADRGSATWAGHTQAIIERLEVPAGDHELDPWSYRAPSGDDWATLVDRCDRAQQPWADELRRTIPAFVALAELMGPPDRTDLIITHTDFQPQNVLVDHHGQHVLLDWDDAGPSTRASALASLINNWHIHGQTVDQQGIRATMDSYRAAGGTGQITTVSDFGAGICGYLNYVQGQAALSLDHDQPTDLRLDAGHRMPGLLSPLPVAVYEEAIRAAAAR